MAVLTHNEASQKVDELRKKLDKWADDYYAKDAPVVEDAVYDKTYQELVELEQKFSDLVTADSITQRVGGEIKSDLSKVEHPVPMLSMGMFSQKMSLKNLTKELRN